jgi:hypothetical protein
VPLPDIGEPVRDMEMPPQPEDQQFDAGGGDDDQVVNEPMSVFPKPQRMFDEDMPGGAYLSMPDKADVTGHRAAQASIGIGEGGKPYFHASRDEVDETGTCVLPLCLESLDYILFYISSGEFEDSDLDVDIMMSIRGTLTEAFLSIASFLDEIYVSHLIFFNL